MTSFHRLLQLAHRVLQGRHSLFERGFGHWSISCCCFYSRTSRSAEQRPRRTSSVLAPRSRPVLSATACRQRPGLAARGEYGLTERLRLQSANSGFGHVHEVSYLAHSEHPSGASSPEAKGTAWIIRGSCASRSSVLA